ncbi:MAG: hypothetical protein PHQ27_11020, partial [Victivallales bacterium]|nr:hypothetical protein [Victivallales bacterium]
MQRRIQTALTMGIGFFHFASIGLSQEDRIAPTVILSFAVCRRLTLAVLLGWYLASPPLVADVSAQTEPVLRIDN